MLEPVLVQREGRLIMIDLWPLAAPPPPCAVARRVLPSVRRVRRVPVRYSRMYWIQLLTPFRAVVVSTNDGVKSTDKDTNTTIVELYLASTPTFLCSQKTQEPQKNKNDRRYHTMPLLL